MSQQPPPSDEQRLDDEVYQEPRGLLGRLFLGLFGPVTTRPKKRPKSP